jgi:hypothetical protein
MGMAARILDKLRQSPFSVEDLASDLKRKPYEARLLVNALLREGSIVKLRLITVRKISSGSSIALRHLSDRTDQPVPIKARRRRLVPARRSIEVSRIIAREKS